MFTNITKLWNYPIYIHVYFDNLGQIATIAVWRMGVWGWWGERDGGGGGGV